MNAHRLTRVIAQRLTSLWSRPLFSAFAFLATASMILGTSSAQQTCPPLTGVNCDNTDQWKRNAACACVDLRYADPRFFEAYENWRKSNSSQENDAAKRFGTKGVWGWRSGAGEDLSTVKIVSRTDKDRLCSGVLVSSRTVLTAGHCLAAGVGAAGDTVLFGPIAGDRLDAIDDAITPPGEGKFISREVAKVLFQQYDQTGKKPDYAILLLSEKAPFAPAQIAANNEVESAKSARALGFGFTEHGTVGDKVFVELLIVSLNCSTSFTHKYTSERIRDSIAYGCLPGRETVAAGFVNVGSPRVSSDTCDGDSGGPLMIQSKRGKRDHVVLGLTSRAVDSRVFPSATVITPTGIQLRCGSGGIYTLLTGPVLRNIVNILATNKETLGK